MVIRNSTVGVLKGRHPDRPDGREWVPFGGPGPTGDPGPMGPTGPTGPPGAVGVDAASAEVWVNNNPPNPSLNPAVELWYDLDDVRPPALSEIPPAGAAGAPMTMRSDTHGDVVWGPTLLPLTDPGTVQQITTRNLTTVVLAAPTWEGDVMMTGALSAESIEDRGYEQHLQWEELDIGGLLLGSFSTSLTIGPCRAWRNRYCTLLDMAFHSDPTIPEEVWTDVAQLPVGWRPLQPLWDTRPSGDVLGAGPFTENRITAGGMVQIMVKALQAPPQRITSTLCVYYCWPRGVD